MITETTDLDSEVTTRHFANADASVAIPKLVAYLKEEHKALKEAGGADQKIADLALALALLVRDQDGDVVSILEFCDQAKGHPLVLEVLIGLATGASDESTLSEIASALHDHTDKGSGEVAKVAEVLSSTWLYRFACPKQAIEAAAPGLGEHASNALRDTYALALAMREEWELLEKFYAAEKTAEGLCRALQVATDCENKYERALVLLKEVREVIEGRSDCSQYAHYTSILEMQLLAQSDASEVERIAALERRVALLEKESPESAELSATRFAHALAMEQAGEDEKAQAIFSELTSQTGWSTSIAQLSTLRIASHRADWEEVVTQLGKLAVLAKEDGLEHAYRRRKAEVLEHGLRHSAEAVAAWSDLGDQFPSASLGTRSLLRLQMDQPKELVAQLIKAASTNPRDEAMYLRRAMIVTEARLHDIDEACVLARRLADSSKSSADLHSLARLRTRQGTGHGVALVYKEIASLEVDERVAVPLLQVGSLLELNAAREQQALELLAEAAKRAPKQLATQIILAGIHGGRKNTQEFCSCLTLIGSLSACDETKFGAYQEQGRTCLQVGDDDGARAALAKAAELRPEDGRLLLSLADLRERNGEWKESVALRERAAATFDDKEQVSATLQAIGRIHQEELSDCKAALAVYERARSISPDDATVLRRCTHLYQELGEPTQQLESLRAELALASQQHSQTALLLAIAKVATNAGESSDASIEAYQRVLAIEENNSEALEGLLELATQSNRCELVIAAFSAARETARNVKVLCGAYEQCSDWKNLVEAQTRYAAMIQNKSDKSDLAAKNAEIYETRLEDDRSAIAAHRKALDHQPARTSSHEALVRLLESRGLWVDVAAAIEAQLGSIPEEEGTEGRRVALLCRRAEILQDELGSESDAALALEAVLALDGTNEEAVLGLEKLYHSLGRDAPLLRILEMRHKRDAGDELLAEVAQLRETTGDIDGALAAYFSVFLADTSNRDVFSELEKLCYSKQRWHDVLRLYHDVIASVEAGESKAFRLGDLYARQGQVQQLYAKDSAGAATSYLKVLEVEPGNEEAMQVLRDLYSESEDWGQLIAAYELRATHTDDATLKVESLRLAAEVARSKSASQGETVRIYRALSELNPEEAKASESLEEFYTETKDWAQLMKVLEARLAHEQANGQVSTDLLKRLAKVAEEGLRDDGRAVKYYEMLIELAPQNRRSLDALARIFESTERWTEFVEVTRRLVKVTKDRSVKALLYFKCGSVTEAKFGNEDDAIRYYDAAIKTSPACLPAVHGLRDLYLRREDWARVIQTLELETKLWQDDKERAGVFAQMGTIYGDKMLQPDQAMHYFESALAVDTDCVPANRALFEHFFSEREWARAQPLAQALAPRAMRDGDPTRRSEFYRKRGVVSSHMGDLVASAESIVIALEIKPENIQALEGLTELAARAPAVYDFPATFRELHKIYDRRADSQQLLALVMVGEAQVMTRAGKLVEAEALLQEARTCSPEDFAITEALVGLHESVRNWPKAVAVLENSLTEESPVALRVTVMMRQAEIYADGQMDAEQAVSVLQRIREIDAENPEVHYLLAQELFCLERFSDARSSIQRVIELAAAPGVSISAERLARYYYYLGRSLDGGGDQRGAMAQYRRATDYDPGYAPPAQALAQHSMEAGDVLAAETRLVESAHAAMGQGDKESAIQLQRSLARILLKEGDRASAIDAYRGILEVNERGAADRLSLAEIYAGTDLYRAIDETRRVIQVDLRHGPAYRVLAGYYMLAGEPIRASRVLSTMDLLGYLEDEDERTLKTARAGSRAVELNKKLSIDLRRTLLANEDLLGVLGELFTTSSHQMSQVNRVTSLGDNLTPISAVDDHALQIAVGDMVRLFGKEPEVYVGDNVPGRVTAIDSPRSIIVLDRVVLQEPEAARRFALGWAFEATCGGYASVLNLGERQRTEMGNLLRSLFLAEAQRATATSDFITGLSPSAQDVIRRHEGSFQDFDMEEWMIGMNAVARRAGLLACDDLAACARMLAVIEGESIGDNHSALGTVFCGEDLFQFHMSDEYDQLRSALNQVPGQF